MIVGGWGCHARYWWFISSCRTKRSKCPVHRPPIPQRCQKSTLLSLFNVVFPKSQCIPTAQHKHMEKSWNSVIDRGKNMRLLRLWHGRKDRRWWEGSAGRCVGFMPTYAAGSNAAAQQRFQALFLAITLKVLPEVLTAPPVLPTGFSLHSKSTNYFL